MAIQLKKIGTGVWVLIMAASAVAVVFLNALAFGLSAETVYDSLVFTAFVASSVTVFVLVAAPRLERYRFYVRASAIIFGIVPATFAGVFLAAFFLQFVNPFERVYSLFPSPRTVTFSLVISYIFGFGGYLYLTSRGKLIAAKALIEEKEEAEQMARTLASEARIASLESRIRPHFLFNTLNSIAALIREDPKRAERMVERLSNILRYSLDTVPEPSSSLEKELAIVRDYLEIQKSRFADKLEYEFEIDDSLKSHDVPTFAIQTLVENSIKHAGDNPDATSIRIAAFVQNGNMVLNVSDNGNSFSAADLKKGHGLDNLRERLKLIYKGNASVEIGSGESASVSIIMPNDG